ncbi:MAG: magnesium transporter [Planctomycetia bacterium]|nr:magnesium transporter [Planctomycetia bacterium]
MTNTLYLPELREMLAEGNAVELHEFCVALHPARTAEFMEGLTAAEAWRVLQHTDPASQVEIFRYFELPRQVEMFETVALEEMAKFISGLPADERVDILSEVQPEIVQALLPLIPVDERRDIMRLAAYPEGTAGAMMTTRFARLSESETAAQALDHVRRQADLLETIYYLYVVDKDDHLRGLVSLRQLVLTEPESLVRDIMRRDAISVDVTADQELVAQKFAKFDFLALPVVDSEHHLLGIVTHDDAIDVVVEEATEDAQRIGGVNPLSTGYIDTKLFELAWKRGVWLMILFFGALLTAFALKRYEHSIDEVAWLVLFLPLIISSGGNTGSQSATLIITALSTGDITLRDWWRVVKREIATGLILGTFLGAIGYVVATTIGAMMGTGAPSPRHAVVIPITLVLVVICGTLSGSMLPLLFRRLGLDPAIMSNPFVSCICDIVGIVIYMQVAIFWLH